MKINNGFLHFVIEICVISQKEFRQVTSILTWQLGGVDKMYIVASAISFTFNGAHPEYCCICCIVSSFTMSVSTRPGLRLLKYNILICDRECIPQISRKPKYQPRSKLHAIHAILVDSWQPFWEHPGNFNQYPGCHLLYRPDLELSDFYFYPKMRRKKFPTNKQLTYRMFGYRQRKSSNKMLLTFGRV